MENLISRAKNMVVMPKVTWDVIKTEETSIPSLLSGYVFPLALIPAIASFIGYGFIGFNVGFFGQASSIEWGISQAITTFATAFIGIFISAWVISQLAKNFGTTVSLNDAIKLVAYSYTPSLLSGAFYLIPALTILTLIGGIYSLYVLYLGFQPITNVNEQQKTSYFLISLIAIIAVSVVVTFVLGIILTTFGLVGYQSFKI
jgi:hypothetical protein